MIQSPKLFVLINGNGKSNGESHVSFVLKPLPVSVVSLVVHFVEAAAVVQGGASVYEVDCHMLLCGLPENLQSAKTSPVCTYASNSKRSTSGNIDRHCIRSNNK